MLHSDYYTAKRILSVNAFINFIVGVRNTGKTWAFKMRAWLRFKRRRKKTVWVRRSKNEVKDACAEDNFYTRKLQKLLKMTDENFKWNGRRGYAKVGKSWVWFIEVTTVLNASKGADDPDVDTIVYDEFTATKRKLSHYHGNEVEDFLSLIITKKRQSTRFRVFLLGNDETFVNPYYTYLTIPSPEKGFVGIRKYKNGSIAVEIIDPALAPKYDDKVADALRGTRFYDYLTTTSKLDTPSRVEKCPKNARFICQLEFGAPCSLWASDGRLYVKSHVDKRRLIFTNRPVQGVRFQIVKQSERKAFESIAEAYKMGRVYYDDGKAYEAFTPFLRYLNIL